MEKDKVADNMIKYGGDFVSFLGLALRRADTFNAQIIKEAWPKMWLKYLAME